MKPITANYSQPTSSTIIHQIFLQLSCDSNVS